MNDATGREAAHPKGRRPPYPTEALLKIVVLQQLYGNLADEQMEYRLLDRMSWQRFTGLVGHRHLPTPARSGHLKSNSPRVAVPKRCLTSSANNSPLPASKFAADAAVFTVPRTNLSESERETVNQGETPAHWSDKQAAHKDTDARWTKKHNKSFYGYKAHINTDQKHKLICSIDATSANVDDRVLLDNSPARIAEGKTVHADRGYHGEVVRDMLKQKGLIDGVARKDAPKRYDQNEIHARNCRLAKIRARVEHVFGDWWQSSGKTLRSIGKVRAGAQIILRACVYNLRRWVVLDMKGACSV